jgi:nucleoside-diphosphate-sugar epimerase
MRVSGVKHDLIFMTLLFTGIHGFVGSNLVSALKERHSIYGLDIVSPEKEGIIKTYSWNEMDLLPEVDAIIHLAGKAHDTKNRTEAQTYFDINTGLTQKIFDYFLQSKAKQFIFFSSVKAAADTVEGDCLTEEVIPKPVGPYGESKIAAEKYIQVHGVQYTVMDEKPFPLLPYTVYREPCTFPPKSVYIFRPCMIHGPGNKGNLNLLYQFVNKGIPYPLGAFENRRSFLNIWNLSYIVEQFILQNPASGIYHLADDEPVSTNMLIKLIAQSKGRKAKIWNCNKSLIKNIARIGDVCKLPLNSDRLQKLAENYVVSNQKMKQALGIERLPVNSIEGLERTLRTF